MTDIDLPAAAEKRLMTPLYEMRIDRARLRLFLRNSVDRLSSGESTGLITCFRS